MDIDIEYFIDEFVIEDTLLNANRILDLNYITFDKTNIVHDDDIEYNFKCISQSIAKKVYLVELNFYIESFKDYDEYEDYDDYDEGEEFVDLIASCTCKHNKNEMYCKHVVACMLYLDKIIIKNNGIGSTLIKEEPKMEINKGFKQFYAYQNISEYNLFAFLSYAKKNKIFNEVIYNNTVKIVNETEDKSLTATVTLKKDIFNVEVKKVAYGIMANCSCLAKVELCEHSNAVLYYILKTKRNANYLDTLINVEDAKNELLRNYGINTKDEEAKYFEFYFEDEDLKMRSKKGMVTSLKNWETGSYLKNSISKNKAKKEFTPNFCDGYICILKTYATYPELRWEVFNIVGSLDNITAIENRIDTNNLEELEISCKPDAQFVFNATAKGLSQYFVKNKIMGSSYGYSYASEYELRNFASYKTLEYRKGLFDYYSKEWERLLLTNNYYTSNAKGNKHKLTDIVKLNFSAQPIKIHLKFSQSNKFCKLEASIKIDEEFFEISEFTNYNFLLLVKNNIAYLPQNETTFRMLMNFENKRELIFQESEAQALIKEYLLPLRKELSIDLPEKVLPKTFTSSNIKSAVKLSEMMPNYLLFQPIMKYDEFETEIGSEEVEILKNDKVILLQRNYEREEALKNTLISLHPSFADQEDQPYFYLTFAKALEKGWFFEALKTLTENNIEVYGQKELQKFKYNSNKAAFSIGGGSGIDWFDLTIALSYGDQVVPLKALKQALINKQDFVQLGDGTLGVLPQEWIKKMTTLFKIGNIKNDGELQVSKFHYTLIDEMHDAINADEILQELELKKQQLNQIDNIVSIKKSKNILATLRPYQLSGLNWFNQMHTIGWGGCLADDMGLGKTLQTLCFFQKLHDENKKVKLLIVCPTSLIYNWQAEIDKFTKGLKYEIFHGTDRVFPEPNSNNWNILITSYGTLRNSLKEFQTIHFDVTVLDESQAIKNPISQVTKAVQLINTKLRFILSGTPVQNNTFDLYAQLNFCNPGLLGNQDFFKSEFAIPIDKNGDTEKSQQLRKMVFPFILRRTKEQVAKDLPDKTETVMYCEMSSYQQKVYDSVKEDYKLRILGKIDEQGVAKSAFLILEGLNKLRQICDCPSLVNNEDTKKFKSDSVKLNELSREIEENISNHKMLVFSQFLGMLSLVKDKLDKDGIKYIYLDGSTPAKDRKGLVDQFQTDPTIQVFLISLKAGGVGLNLTAADYVYIIDPWWNPAVEDQAIDRTHRIGQNKKVFAYKMICKNTIEEKIMQLQAKKKSLAKELISEDASFVKKLTRDDVAWLLT